jgi:hypothetical protein
LLRVVVFERFINLLASGTDLLCRASSCGLAECACGHENEK